MDDLLNSLKAQLYDRVSSPLLSSFVISWVLWNHRLFVVMVSSDLKLIEKFTYVDNVLYPTAHEVGLRGFIWPLLSALALLFLYPIPGRWVYEYVRREQKRLKEIQQKIDDEMPLTKEEARELRVAMRRADAEFEKELAEKDDIISRLREQIPSPQGVADTSMPSSSRLGAVIAQEDAPPIEINEAQVAVLEKIAQASDGLDEEVAVRSGGADRVVGQFNLDELVKNRLVRRVAAGYSRGPRYKATAEGRAILVHRRQTQP